MSGVDGVEELDRDEAQRVARTVLMQSRQCSHPHVASASSVGYALETKELDWRSVPELLVLRNQEALHQEFLRRKEEDIPHRLGALLYAVMKFPNHVDAPEMLNCCAFNRWHSARNRLHLVQALQGFDVALRIVRSGNQKWKIAINRWSLLNFMGAPSVALRSAGWLLAEIPPGDAMYRFVCYALGRSYFMLGRYDLAAAAWERSAHAFADAEQEVRDQVYTAWARAIARSGHLSQARDILSRVGDQTSGHCLAAHAELLFLSREWLAFVGQAKAALRNFPSQAPWSWERLTVAELHQQLSEAYGLLGQYELGRNHLAVSRLLGLALGANSQVGLRVRTTQ